MCVGSGDRKRVFKDKQASSVSPSWRSPGNTRRESESRLVPAGAAAPSSYSIGSSCTLEEEQPSSACCFRRRDALLSVLVWEEASRCCARRRTDPDLPSRFPGSISGGTHTGNTPLSWGAGVCVGRAVGPTTNLIRGNKWPLNPGGETPGGVE